MFGKKLLKILRAYQISSIELSNYKWNERLDVSIFTCLNYNISYKIRNQLYKLKRGVIKDVDILNKINSSSPLNVQLVSGQFSLNENDIGDFKTFLKHTARVLKMMMVVTL